MKNLTNASDLTKAKIFVYALIILLISVLFIFNVL